MTKVCVVGAAGRMGGHVLAAVSATDDLTLAAALESAGHPDLGKEVAAGVPLSSDIGAALDASDVAIDFSLPESALALAREAPPRGTALVIATTGLSADQDAEIARAAQSVAVVRAANFSLGITTLLGLVEEAVSRLPNYEIEVLEIHHNQKVDAPSGTALALGEAAAGARGDKLSDVATYHREGHTGPRDPRAIGMQTLRGGDIVGEHTVYLVGPGERLELTHRALSRENFAAGAVRAARWAVGKAPGLYSMRDVLEA